jgi:YgiT-type zinc finger domain-containing protein
MNMEGMNSMEKYCPICGDFTTAEVRVLLETYPVKGENVQVEAQVLHCLKCGEALFDPDLDGENLERAYQIYRQRHGLLGPADVKVLRERYGLIIPLFYM